MEPNLDWRIVNCAVENTFWAIKGIVIEFKIGIGDSERQGKGLIVEGGIGVA